MLSCNITTASSQTIPLGDETLEDLIVRPKRLKYLLCVDPKEVVHKG